MEWLAISISLAAIIISIAQFRLERVKRRDSMRLIVYQKQVELYEGLFKMLAEMDDLLSDLNQVYSVNSEVIKDLDSKMDALHLFSVQQELYIPDELFGSTDRIVTEMWKRLKMISQNNASWNDAEIKKHNHSFLNFEEEVREYLGIRKLSSENRNLAKNYRKN